MSAGPTGCGRTWDGMVAAWYSTGPIHAHGRVWALMGAVMGTVLSQTSLSWTLLLIWLAAIASQLIWAGAVV